MSRHHHDRRASAEGVVVAGNPLHRTYMDTRLGASVSRLQASTRRILASIREHHQYSSSSDAADLMLMKPNDPAICAAAAGIGSLAASTVVVPGERVEDLRRRVFEQLGAPREPAPGVAMMVPPPFMHQSIPSRPGFIIRKRARSPERPEVHVTTPLVTRSSGKRTVTVFIQESGGEDHTRSARELLSVPPPLARRQRVQEVESTGAAPYIYGGAAAIMPPHRILVFPEPSEDDVEEYPATPYTSPISGCTTTDAPAAKTPQAEDSTTAADHHHRCALCTRDVEFTATPMQQLIRFTARECPFAEAAPPPPLALDEASPPIRQRDQDITSDDATATEIQASSSSRESEILEAERTGGDRPPPECDLHQELPFIRDDL